MTLPPEKMLIHLIADPDSAPDQSGPAANASEVAEIGDEVIDLAVSHGLGGLLHKRLQHRGLLGCVPPARRQELKQIYYATIRNNLRLTHALVEILDHLNAGGMRTVLLQGMALLANLYSDPGLRPLSDIDLWVLPRDIDDFAAGMQRLGYVQKPHHPLTFLRDSVIVDIHTHVFWADRIRARRWLLKLDQREMFDAAQTVDVDGRAVGVLSAPDQFIYLGLHVIKHRAKRWIWLVDIRELVDRWTVADWQTLEQRALQIGQDRNVRHLLFLLEDVFDFQPPQAGFERMKFEPLKFWERIFLRRRGLRASLSIWSPLVLMPADIGFPKKCVFFLENLFPDPGVLRQVFSRRAHLKNWQLYGLRALQLLGVVKAG